MGLGRSGTNKRIGLEQETKHGGLDRHRSFTSKPAFFTLTASSETVFLRDSYFSKEKLTNFSWENKNPVEK
jgi:hypothetical protein